MRFSITYNGRGQHLIVTQKSIDYNGKDLWLYNMRTYTHTVHSCDMSHVWFLKKYLNWFNAVPWRQSVYTMEQHEFKCLLRASCFIYTQSTRRLIRTSLLIQVRCVQSSLRGKKKDARGMYCVSQCFVNSFYIVCS